MVYLMIYKRPVGTVGFNEFDKKTRKPNHSQFGPDILSVWGEK